MNSTRLTLCSGVFGGYDTSFNLHTESSEDLDEATDTSERSTGAVVSVNVSMFRLETWLDDTNREQEVLSPLKQKLANIYHLII